MTGQQYLDIAFKTERFISQQQHETPHGIVWSLAKEKPDVYLHTLYAGSAGIAVFYLELYRATGEQAWLQKAEQAGLDLAQYVQAKETLTCSALGGWAGYMFVLNEIANSTGNATFQETASYCAQKLRDQATDRGSGIGWVAPMPYANLTGQKGLREIYDVAEGAAGVGLYYLYAHEQRIHAEALTWVKAIADRLLEIAEPAKGGLRWQLMDDIPWPFDAPNFAHGTAGVAYFLARSYEALGDQQYLNAALSGAEHVQAMAEPIGDDGHLVPHILNDDRPNRYYLGMCHGPAGTARLFYLLANITGESRWMDWSKGLDRGLNNLGAPEKRGRGLWNNVSQCCCDAGIGDHALFMYRVTGEQFYLDLAERVAAELIRRGVTDGNTICWPQAEHRSQPDFIETQTGYMQGAAGVASFFVHLATTLSGEPCKIIFPDAPYGRLTS